MKLGLEIAGLLAGGGRGALDEGGLEPRHSPRLREGRLLRIRVERRERRVPALSSFLGHRPAQDIRCPAVAKRVMSRPISARMTQALNSSMPGMVVKSWTAV